MIPHCQAKDCNEIIDVQYIHVYPSDKKPRKEYYCQPHLRKRVLQLELMRLSNKITKEIKGWK